jgi:anti-sigma regulatory factor (Ser/Thr protein kinase)
MARAFTLTALAGWGLPRAGDLAEDSALVVTELCTNVVQAAADCSGGPDCAGWDGLSLLWVRLLWYGRALQVEVWDDLPPSAGDPVLREPAELPADLTAELEEHGRGLLMVRDLSRQWGWARAQDGRAKVVWSLLEPAPPLRAPPGTRPHRG